MTAHREPDSALLDLARAIVDDDAALARRLLAASPELAHAVFEQGATRQSPNSYYLERIGYHIYAGATALHVAAAAHRTDVAQALLALGANVRAKNRRGAEPLHAAAVGAPGSRTWNPPAQSATVACLIERGADPNAVDKSGVTPLHRAVRMRCAAAVKSLLGGGADAGRKNMNGSTPMLLALLTTGRGGAGSAEAKAQQNEILRLLEQHGPARS